MLTMVAPVIPSLLVLPISLWETDATVGISAMDAFCASDNSWEAVMVLLMKASTEVTRLINSLPA